MKNNKRVKLSENLLDETFCGDLEDVEENNSYEQHNYELSLFDDLLLSLLWKWIKLGCKNVNNQIIIILPTLLFDVLSSTKEQKEMFTFLFFSSIISIT